MVFDVGAANIPSIRGGLTYYQSAPADAGKAARLSSDVPGDCGEHSLREAIDSLSDEFSLTEAERAEFLASGQQAIFNNRVGWARTYLKKAGLLDSTRRGFFRITDPGKKVLSRGPNWIDVNFLEQFDEFVQFRSIRKEKNHSEEAGVAETINQTPEESLESAYQKLREGLASEILQITKSCSPAFFDQLVVDLLVKMC